MISVIIPLYNKEQSIKKSIVSILEQDFANMELIVVDDGSTDNSVDVVNSIDDARIVLIQQKNAGPGAARNTGVRNSKGDWIVFLDADDELLSGALVYYAKMAEQYPDVDIFDCNRYFTEKENTRLGYHPLEGYVKNPMRAWYYYMIAPGCGHSMYRADFVKKYPYDERMRRYEDADLLLRMLQTAKVYSCSKPTENKDVNFAEASQPRKDIKQDLMGYLDMSKGGFWYKMCVFRTFIEERENYKQECHRLYPELYKRYDLLLLYKLLPYLQRIFI